MIGYRRFLWTLVLGVMLGVVVGSVLSYVLWEQVYGGAEVSLPRHVRYHPGDSREVPVFRLDTIETKLPRGLNFVYAAKTTIPSVVHVRIRKQMQGQGFFYGFFSQGRNDDRMIVSGAGSGVIIDSDGYIATNHHVVEHAEQIEVVLVDNRAYEAELVGVDPTTDLALLRIEEEGLSAVSFGNSDSLEIGAWVLAVGNPFDLRSTVTAGIVSAKGRNISSINDSLSVESFIQTDAVVNRGNSGGALVNLSGELMGINTAIFTQGGGYEGYSFAVPATLVRKVMSDLRNYGEVRRAVLGIQIQSLSAALAQRLGVAAVRGVFIAKVWPGGAADQAGVQETDIITHLDDQAIRNTPELQEKIARQRPGDQVELQILRAGEPLKLRVELMAASDAPKRFPLPQPQTAQGPSADKKQSESVPQGLRFRPLSREEQQKFRLKTGLVLTAIDNPAWRREGLQTGFILTHINEQEVTTVRLVYEQLQRLKQDQSFVLRGIDPSSGDEVSHRLLR